MLDKFTNGALATITNAPGTGGTSIVLTTGQGARFPSSGTFRVAVWPGGESNAANTEIILISSRSSDTLTVSSRSYESSTNLNIVAGYRIGLPLTAGQLAMMYPIPVTCQGRLVAVGSAQTTLYFVPYNGNVVSWDSTYLTLTGYSCSITNAGLSANTLYYVYVYNNSGSPALELSQTVYDSTISSVETGIRRKTGDASRLLVGMIYTDASSKFNMFAGDGVNPGKMNVISWYNQALIFVAGVGALASTSSVAPTWVDVASTGNNHFEFINWGPVLGIATAVTVGISGVAAMDSATKRGDIRFGLAEQGGDNATGSVMSMYGTLYASDEYENMSGSSTSGYPEGHHQFAIYCRCYSGATMYTFFNSFGSTWG